VGLGHSQQILTGFASWLRYYTDVAERRSTKLCTMFGRFQGWYTIYTFWWLLPPNEILPGAKFTLRPSLAISYIGSVTARHSSSGHQANCGVQQRAPPIFGRAAITLGIGPYFVQLLQCLQDTPLFLQKIRTAMHCCVRTIATSEL